MTEALCKVAKAITEGPSGSRGIVSQPHGGIVSQSSGKTVQVSLREEALDFKKFSKAEMDAKEDRKVYVWPLPKKSEILPQALVQYVNSKNIFI